MLRLLWRLRGERMLFFTYDYHPSPLVDVVMPKPGNEIVRDGQRWRITRVVETAPTRLITGQVVSCYEVWGVHA